MQCVTTIFLYVGAIVQLELGQLRERNMNKTISCLSRSLSNIVQEDDL